MSHAAQRILLASSLMICGAGGALATEGGGGAYPNGAESFMTGFLPPPGFYVVSYNQYYTASSFKNSSPLFNDFSADVAATVFRAIYVSDIQIFGANWAMHAFLPIASVNASFGGMSGRSSGIGDIIIDPFILGWHFGDWNVVTGFDITLPTGKYDPNSIANPGRNYMTFTPVFAFTYLNKDGWEVSAKVMYDFNTENQDTNYQSGQELHADFVAAKHFGPLAIGVGGYAYRQTTPDSGYGAVFGGFEGQAVALGPQLMYNSGKLTVVAKYMSEFAVENRPQGDKIWLNIVAAF
ncbi:transporter [Xanthobacter sp. V4C-4]|uniref:SphA family protein n=1 Tax=Xanthobacter cornucopiae TaxID=3119924 RepID=UPI003729C280